MTESKPTKPCCGNCRFWQHKYEQGPFGECHRYPPVRDPQRVRCVDEFPDTCETDWCGEHQPLDPSNEQPATNQ